MLKIKKKNLNIRINEEHYEKIKELADEESLSQSDFIIMKCLGLKPIIKEEIKEYPLKVGSYNYIQKKVAKTKEYVPV